MQKKRGQAAERNVAINDEVSKLVTAGIMREVHYHDWLSNPVMVKKSDNSWRMCVDFKDLLIRHVPRTIQMAEEDEEKTAFITNQGITNQGITNQGIFYYTKMPFGLRNARATYQRLVDKTFHEQIGRNLEVYVDDLVIKSRTEDGVDRDIEETFKTLRKINMKLNPKKCTFGVEEGMFLGYQVNTKGIKICPDKVDAVLSLQSPKCLKDVQKLNGKLASLNKFLAKSAEKSLPFFKTLKKCTKKSNFLWTEETEAAFRQMKEHIAKLPMLTSPEGQEELIVYLAASKEAVRAVLMTEREARQMPIYFANLLCQPSRCQSTSSTWQHPRSKCRLKTGSKPSKWDLHRKRDRHDQILRKGKSTGQYLSGVFNKASPKKQEQKSGCTKQNGIRQLRTSQQTGVGGRIERKIRPWLRCVGPSQANYVLQEIHEGLCSMHAGTRSVVAKALRTGYYWPTMHKDARALIKACQECQVHKPIPRNPQEKLNLITSPWPFYKWGIDIAGPFPEEPGKVKFLIVAVDYFTKWIEAKPVATITGNQVKKFVWENIVCRFGLPGEIISDNGKQFRDNPFKDWCEKMCIQQHFAFVKHPHTNELVERASRSLGEGIKARLGKDNKN
ncbi:reverse transcriptase domain-containing protein [Tanacetum coccineum]